MKKRSSLLAGALISIGLLVLIGAAVGAWLSDGVNPSYATLRGKVEENSVVMSKIGRAWVTVAGRTALTDAKNEFTFEAVSVGRQPVTVAVPDDTSPSSSDAGRYEPYSTALNIRSGDNSVVLRLALTPVETYRRYATAYRKGHYWLAYKYIHPALKKNLTYEQYSGSFAGDKTLSVTMGGRRLIKKWFHPDLRKTFRNVIQVDRTVVGINRYGQRYTNKRRQHWQKVSGRWYILTPL